MLSFPLKCNQFIKKKNNQVTDDSPNFFFNRVLCMSLVLTFPCLRFFSEFKIYCLLIEWIQWLDLPVFRFRFDRISYFSTIPIPRGRHTLCPPINSFYSNDRCVEWADRASFSLETAKSYLWFHEALHRLDPFHRRVAFLYLNSHESVQTEWS